MKGMALARDYYNEYGAAMIRELFPAYEGRIACGLAGSGSECFGFDDEYSQDHDFGPGFCLWLTDEDEKKTGAALRAEYANLPKAYKGFASKEMVVSGERRVGPMRISDFYFKFTGVIGAPQTLDQWREIPETFLAAAVNGEVFRDDLGEFSKLRDILSAFYPEDIRLKKIVARAAIMAQAGQYNYPRCIQRGERVAAQNALSEFINAASSMVYLLNKKYMPFYKWAHRGMKDLPILNEVYTLLSILCSDETKEGEQIDIIEEICVSVKQELMRQKLSEADENFLLDHCEGMKRKIRDPQIRSLHIMAE